MSATCSQVLAAHHQACDADWAAAEEHALRGRWVEAAPALQRFLGEMAKHLSAEEAVLFPAFEEATGMTGGPTTVMRFEHDQLRELFGQLEQALKARDAERFAGAGETMLVLLQQHNLKEERMLYPACDQALGRSAAVVGQLEQRLGAPAP